MLDLLDSHRSLADLNKIYIGTSPSKNDVNPLSYGNDHEKVAGSLASIIGKFDRYQLLQ